MSSLTTRTKQLVLEHPVLIIFFLAFAIRALIAILLTGAFSGRYLHDDGTYHAMASDVVQGRAGGWDPYTRSLYSATSSFMWPVTAIYEVFGPHQIAAQLFVATLGAAVAAVVTRLAMEMMDRRWAIIAGLLVALFPSQAFWSSMLMKDAAVWLVLSVLALTVAVANRSTGRPLLVAGLGAAGLLFLIAFLRLHTMVVASWALMLGAVVGRPGGRLQRIIGAVTVGVCVPLLIGAGPAGLGLVLDAGSLEQRRLANAAQASTAVVDLPRPVPTPTADPEIVNEVVRRAEEVAQRAEEARVEASESSDSKHLARRAERLEERAARLRMRAEGLVAAPPPAPPPVVPDEVLDPDIAHLPRGISVMLLEPFPLPLTGSFALRLARLESVLWYPLLVLAAIGVLRARSTLRVLAFPILATGAIVVMYALTEGNVGTAHRHRGEFVWAVLFLATFGLNRLGRNRSASDNP